MSEILSREEFEAAQSGSVTHQIPQPALDTIEALAAALNDTMTYYDLTDTTHRKSVSQKVRNAYERVNTLREKGWIE